MPKKRKRVPRKPKITTMTQAVILMEVEKSKKYYASLPAKLEAAIAERDAYQKSFIAATNSRGFEIIKRDEDIAAQKQKIVELERERNNALAYRDKAIARIAELEAAREDGMRGLEYWQRGYDELKAELSAERKKPWYRRMVASEKCST